MQGKRQGRQGTQGGGGQLQQSHVKIHTVIMWQTKTIDKRPKARSAGGRSGGGGMAGYGTSLNRRRGAFPPVSQPASHAPRITQWGRRRLLIFHTCSPTTRKAKRAKEKRKKRARNLSNNFSCVRRVCVCCVCVWMCVCSVVFSALLLFMMTIFCRR